VNAEPRAARTAREGSHVEQFHLLAWRWDVTAAKALAAGRAPNATLVPADWAGLLRLIRIDADHAATVDLAQPLIAVPIPHDGGPLIIDGWHRLHQALSTGVEHLAAILLTAEEELACRIHGGEKGYGWRR